MTKVTSREVDQAYTISSYLQRTDPMSKTIVFCNDIDHAERMRRALIKHNPEELLAEYHQQQERIAELQNQLKTILSEALISS